MIQFQNISKYDGMFTKCYLEPARDGFSLFDDRNEFVGMIIDEGFCVNKEYVFAETIQKMLTEKGLTVVGYDDYEKIRSENDIAKALYGDPE